MIQEEIKQRCREELEIFIKPEPKGGQHIAKVSKEMAGRHLDMGFEVSINYSHQHKNRELIRKVFDAFLDEIIK